MANAKFDRNEAMKELQQHIKELGLKENLHPDQAFILWFLKVYLGVEGEQESRNCLNPRSNDKKTDAIYIDHAARQVNLIQGKYREKGAGKTENNSEVISFAQLGRLLTQDKNELEKVTESADPVVKERLAEVRKLVRNRGYELNLYFITTGKVSKATITDAEEAAWVDNSIHFYAVHGNYISRILLEYLIDLFPAVPSLELEVDGPMLMTRHDEENNIDSYVFTMDGRSVGELMNKGGRRIFAQNIRGFLGKTTDVNRSIADTLKLEPHNFWYFNNGVTIICEEATECGTAGRKALRVKNPQIINGQQTTYMLNLLGKESASLLIKVIAIPREEEEDIEKYEDLVGKIVTATNWQNKIIASDLKANDKEQIRLEREFRKLNILYLRKRMSKSQARTISLMKTKYAIDKAFLAQAVSAIQMDPYYARHGSEPLFESEIYGHIFPYNRDIFDYLTAYHVVKHCSEYTNTNLQKKGKWLVAHFIWQHLKAGLRTKTMKKNFVYVSERRWGYFFTEANYLRHAIDKVHSALRKFYYAKSMSKEGYRIEEGTFFNYKKRHTQFEDYWNKMPAKIRASFRMNIKKFIESIEEID